MTGDEKTHYEVLGVSADASRDEIKRASRRLMQKHHPDRGGDPAMAASINTAMSVLSDSMKREEYDEFLRTGGESAEPEAPDPDSYEDEWGSSEEWEDFDEEEVLDVEVEETMPPSPGPPSPPSPPSPAPDDSQAPPEADEPPEKPTKVRTALWRGLVFGLLPAVALNLIVYAESYLLLRPYDESWTFFPAIGTAVGFLAPLVLRRRLPQTPSPQASVATMTASIVLVVALVFIATTNPLVIPALQTLVATAIGMWVLVANAAHHQLAERIVSSKGLRTDRTMFGPSSGDTSGELLTSTLWSCMARPEMRAARGFQTADTANHFTKAVLLGNRLALIRPMFIPDNLLPEQSPRLYWSPPSLFLAAPSGVPEPLLRLDLSEYRASFKNLAGELTLGEFLVIYTTPHSPTLTLPADDPQMPTLVTGGDAPEAICQFLLGEKDPPRHVDHISAANALMGLEYRLMHS